MQGRITTATIGLIFLLTFSCASQNGRHHDTPMPDPKAYAAHFGDIDRNGDEQVTAEEFQAYFPDGEMKVFETVDADRNGVISHEEWHRFKEAHGMAHH